MTLLEQREMLNFIKKYNTINRKTIKENLFHIKSKYKFRQLDIITDLKFEKEKVSGWYNRKNPNIPTIEDALCLATTYNFNVNELVREDYFGYAGGGN